MLLTSGYGTKILSFSSENHTKKVLFEEKDENISFILKHPEMENILYAVHELEIFQGQKAGAVSRCILKSTGEIEIQEVSKQD